MIYLILSILASTSIFVVFKLFERFRVPVLQAIVVNYIVAFISGYSVYWMNLEGPLKSIPEIMNAGWFYYALLLGTLFIIVFKLMAITTQRIGLSVVSVATKMSVVIPILFGLIYYKEAIGFYKLSGIAAALLSVYLVSMKDPGIKLRKGYLIIPMMVFLGSGIIDTTLKVLEESYVAQDDVSLFSSVIFLAAALIGLLLLLVQFMIGKFTFDFKSLIGGVALGIPNFLTIYFLVMALRSDLFDSSGLFTVNNVSIVTLSTLVGIFFFGEKLRVKNWIGILLAILSIFLIFLSV